jgi:uncharacterized protein
VIRHFLARAAAVALAAAALFAPVVAPAADFVAPPTPTQWVTDTAAFLSPGGRESLNQTLEAYERRTGHQVLVWIGASTGDVPIEEFAVKSFEKWKPGRAGKDDGLVFFLATQDRKMRIEVGYGLEPFVTDLTSSRVIREVVAPRLQAGDPDGGVSAGMAALLQAIDAGEGTAGAEVSGGATARRTSQPARAPRPLSTAQKVLVALVGIALLIFFITNPSLAIWLLMNVLSSSGGYGRSGGSSDGFSGGGGRSGGGGASGSW